MTPALDSLVTVGKCLKPHGIRGEVKVAILTDFPERFESAQTLLLHDGKTVTEYRVEGARFHKKAVLLKLEGVDSMEAAEALRSRTVAIPEEELAELEEDEYWHFELEGLTVVDEEGTTVGELTQVLENPGHDIYVVKGSGGEVLLPAVSEYILEVNLPERRMRVRLPRYA